MRGRLRKFPHDVYRVRDENGTLLYVGCSISAFRRIRQHKNEYQPWFPAARTVDITQYPDLVTARYVEASAIAHESPMWNVAKEERALRRGEHLAPAPVDQFTGIPVSEFWAA